MKLTDLHTNDGQLEGLPENPRYITEEDFNNLKMCLLRMPQYLRHNQIKVEEHNVILGGNMRYLALVSLAKEKAIAQWTDKFGNSHVHHFTDEIPDEWVCHCDDYTLEQKRHIVLADNKSSGHDDLEKLANQWSEDELRDWGNGVPTDWNTDGEDEQEENKAQEDNFDEEKEYIEVRCKKGDVWQLGEHRLMCGDSIRLEDVKKLMGGVFADLWLTDPPYNVNYQGGTEDKLKIQNDNMNSVAFGLFLTDAFATATQVMKEGAPFYVWFASREHVNFETALNKSNLHVRQELIWNKNALVLSRQDYQWKHEPCLYGWKEGAAHYFFDSRKETTVIEDRIDIDKLKKEEMRDLLKQIYSQQKATSIIDCEKPTESREHPTMKPIKLFGYLMRNSSKPGQIVLDTFGGSGTTLIAAEQLGRRARLMEIDPHYCDVILARWEKLTGKQAKRLDE